MFDFRLFDPSYRLTEFSKATFLIVYTLENYFQKYFSEKNNTNACNDQNMHGNVKPQAC